MGALEAKQTKYSTTVYFSINLFHKKTYLSMPYLHFHRPQRSCGQGYVFTHVCDSVHRGVSGQGEPPPGRENPSGRETPRQGEPPGQGAPPGQGDPLAYGQ